MPPTNIMSNFSIGLGNAEEETKHFKIKTLYHLYSYVHSVAISLTHASSHIICGVSGKKKNIIRMVINRHGKAHYMSRSFHERRKEERWKQLVGEVSVDDILEKEPSELSFLDRQSPFRAPLDGMLRKRQMRPHRSRVKRLSASRLTDLPSGLPFPRVAPRSLYNLGSGDRPAPRALLLESLPQD